jgi:phytoene dehydrogenase-like protein
MSDVDVIVIGSGAGGLTAAVALQQSGLKTLVLEQHYVPGGWCHSFTLEGHRFSPGVHYVGELQKGARMRAIYEGLGVSGDLQFCELDPDGFDRVRIGRGKDQVTFDICKGREELTRRLEDRFPAEKKGIRGYMKTVADLADQLNAMLEIKGALDVLKLPFKAPAVARWGLSTMDSLLDKHVRDPMLRAILVAQSGDHGLPPSLAPAPVHASIAAHYFDGGWYPRGGGYVIPRAFVRALQRAGGEIRLSTAVDRILVEDGRAIGVRLSTGEEIRARHVVSNADPGQTFTRLMDPAHVPSAVKRKLARTRWSVSALSLFMATDLDVREAGMTSGNVWAYEHADLDAIYRAGMGTDLSHIPGFFVTATTLKDPSKFRGHHTLEAFAFVHSDAFRAWAGSKYGERPADYEQKKAELTAKMIRSVDSVIPGIAERVTFKELGTPLSNVHYCAATDGNLYGTEKSRWQVGPWAWPIKTQLKGLWLCGASTVSHGVLGATFSGLIAARAILGTRISELLRQRGPELQLLPSERFDVWPEKYRRTPVAAAHKLSGKAAALAEARAE